MKKLKNFSRCSPETYEEFLEVVKCLRFCGYKSDKDLDYYTESMYKYFPHPGIHGDRFVLYVYNKGDRDNVPVKEFMERARMNMSITVTKKIKSHELVR